jgi:hypothetical protein
MLATNIKHKCPNFFIYTLNVKENIEGKQEKLTCILSFDWQTFNGWKSNIMKMLRLVSRILPRMGPGIVRTNHILRGSFEVRQLCPY